MGTGTAHHEFRYKRMLQRSVKYLRLMPIDSGTIEYLDF